MSIPLREIIFRQQGTFKPLALKIILKSIIIIDPSRFSLASRAVLQHGNFTYALRLGTNGMAVESAQLPFIRPHNLAPNPAF